MGHARYGEQVGVIHGHIDGHTGCTAGNEQAAIPQVQHCTHCVLDQRHSTVGGTHSTHTHTHTQAQSAPAQPQRRYRGEAHTSAAPWIQMSHTPPVPRCRQYETRTPPADRGAAAPQSACFGSRPAGACQVSNANEANRRVWAAALVACRRWSVCAPCPVQHSVWDVSTAQARGIVAATATVAYLESRQRVGRLQSAVLDAEVVRDFRKASAATYGDQTTRLGLASTIGGNPSGSGLPRKPDKDAQSGENV